jgi:hypothetical protein
MSLLELLTRALDRSDRLEDLALKASRADDDQGVWLAMAARAENRRLIDALRARLGAAQKQN